MRRRRFSVQRKSFWVLWNCVLVYMDDVIIYSHSCEEHMGHLDQGLGLRWKANVTPKLRKCAFAAREVEYLGHVTRPGRPEMQDSKVAALKAVRRPATQTQLHLFLGLANVYRRFVPGFAKIAKPLTDLTRDEVPATLPEWNRDQTCAFEQLKDALARPPTLALPQYDREFVLDTDASGYQVGCVLQEHGDDGASHPTGYWSRTLNGPKLDYSARERWRSFGQSGRCATTSKIAASASGRTTARFPGSLKRRPPITLGWPDFV
jgi:hypothetical protein